MTQSNLVSRAGDQESPVVVSIPVVVSVPFHDPCLSSTEVPLVPSAHRKPLVVRGGETFRRVSR